MAMIEQRLAGIRENISLICQKLGKNPEEITLVGVTKFASANQVQEAITCGLKDIAENKVQQATDKFTHIQNADVVKHMIGHLQTNKVKEALKVFDIIQSVDSLKLAKEIDKQARKLNRRVNILVQINTSGEPQKYGVAVDEASSLIETIIPLKQIHIQGLMTIAPLTEDEGIIRQCFRGLKKFWDEDFKRFQGTGSVEMKYLSMGMSADYKIALEEGSNMVRIGRAIFADE